MRRLESRIRVPLILIVEMVSGVITVSVSQTSVCMNRVRLMRIVRLISLMSALTDAACKRVMFKVLAGRLSRLVFNLEFVRKFQIEHRREKGSGVSTGNSTKRENLVEQ